MTEIRVACQTLRQLVPALFRRESDFKKHVFLISPAATLKSLKSTFGVTLIGSMSINLPSKKRPTTGPQKVDIKVDVKGLEWNSMVDINLQNLIKGEKKELIQALFLVCLMELGIFNNSDKRKSFQFLVNWPEEKA